jgi:signal peptidase I
MKTKIIVTIFVLLALSVTIYTSLKTKEKSELKTDQKEEIVKESRTVRGNSLSGVINSAEEVTILNGYYKNNKVERDDIILYDYKGSENGIIKIAKGIPGDSIELQKTEQSTNIIINGKILVTSENEPYTLDEKAVTLLSRYIKSNANVIPKDQYLILGNLPQGSQDSTRFGFIARQDILGKVEYVK